MKLADSLIYFKTDFTVCTFDLETSLFGLDIKSLNVDDKDNTASKLPQRTPCFDAYRKWLQAQRSEQDVCCTCLLAQTHTEYI